MGPLRANGATAVKRRHGSKIVDGQAFQRSPVGDKLDGALP